MTDEKELKDQRIPVMMSPSELKAIDDWSFESRIRSRGEAIRRLCQIGLIFDAKRTEIVERFSNILGSASRTLTLANGKRREDMSEDERLIFDANMETLKEVLLSAIVIRGTTGLANNLRGDAELEETLKLVKEVMDQMNDVELTKKFSVVVNSL